MLPNFLGLGANRAGSTWFAHNLMRHADVFVPRGKELHFFDKEFDKGLVHYEAQFADWSGERAVGEVTPAYLYAEDAPFNIHRSLPGVKLFVSLRNPVDRAYSQYWRMKATGGLAEEATFEEALESKDIILRNGRYHEHLSRYYEYFGRQDLLVLVFEKIRTDPGSLLTELFTFLEVDPSLQGSYTTEPINSSGSLPNLGRSNPLYYVQRVLNRLGLYALKYRIDSINRSQLPPMNASTRKALTDYYRDEIVRTEQLTGKDLSAWLLGETDKQKL